MILKNRTRIFTAALLLLGTAACSKGVGHYVPEVIAEYPHDRGAYTQGLFFHDGQLYESTGQNGKSSLRIVDLETGIPVRKVDFEEKYFLEGSVVLDGRLHLLTWLNGEIFTCDPITLERTGSQKYPRQGWGLTTDGKQLIASDGSSKLFFMDPDHNLKRKVTVKLSDKSVRYLNELEFIGGKVWANVYLSDNIMIINPEDGTVEGVIDCKGLLPFKLRDKDTDVLNGIALDPATGDIYLTGKNWPRLYKIRLKRISSR